MSNDNSLLNKKQTEVGHRMFDCFRNLWSHCFDLCWIGIALNQIAWSPSLKSIA